MTSSLGNGAHAVAPGFEGARITPEQAEALAAGFLPSWEVDGGGASAAVANGHAGGDLRTTMKSNGVHAESHAPPSRTRVSEPEDSVVIDRSITADQIAAPPPDSGRVPVASAAAVRLAPPPTAAPAVASVPAPPPPSLRPMPPPSMRPMPPPRPARSAARAPSIDDYVQAPKSKKGLFIGLGIAAAAALALVIGIAVNSGDASKADDSSGPAITVVKPADTPKSPAAPPTATQTATATQIATTPIAAATTPATPVTALPVAPSPDPPRPKPTHAAAAQPTYNNAPAPQPRAAQPRSGGGSAIVKDVPF